MWGGQIQEALEEATQCVALARKHFDLLNTLRPEVLRMTACEGMYKNVFPPKSPPQFPPQFHNAHS